MSDSIGISSVPYPTPGRYIVLLKGGVSLDTHISSIQSSITSTQSRITHRFYFISGYAGEFTADDVNALCTNTDIRLVEEDGVSRTCYETQTDAPWGLGRISSTPMLQGDDLALDYNYYYDLNVGTGVNIYIIDTGIYIEHSDFEKRASWGVTFGGYDDKDGNGHGTHCAGIAISKHFGVAKYSNAIAVKVLGDNGRGYNSDIIAGLQWVAEQAAATGKPSVASMSLGGGASDSLDAAVRALYQSGVPVVVAAGNDNQDCSNSSPARVNEAITVAASNIQDCRAPFSNYGLPVDIFAAGYNVTSTWNDGLTKVLSGTSMATPHVAGVAALLLASSPGIAPAQIALDVNVKALTGVITDVGPHTVNRLLHYVPQA